MEKAKQKTRTILFKSAKNGGVCTVKSPEQRNYAKRLEAEDNVWGYDTCVPLEEEAVARINGIGIRKSYMTISWTTDFKVKRTDGSYRIVEIVLPNELDGPKTLEKLELSRRYWESKGINDWRIYVPEVV